MPAWHRVDPAIEVTVTGQYRGGVKISVDHFLLDFGIERAAHAVTCSTGEGDYAKASCSR